MNFSLSSLLPLEPAGQAWALSFNSPINSLMTPYFEINFQINFPPFSFKILKLSSGFELKPFSLL
ncbi:hypothetical protein KFK09_022154 [Dendrobium nobile]|uniref:Uncharacterized protein n=1 Tax=Dendrobium nobile TaxID=94219 RepID=A0A8T3AHR6_DENNO|nr:hypothetical protein KFK09_022154 [Dendrobium nobile]